MSQRLVHPPRPRGRPTGRLRSGCRRAVGGARHAGSDGASSSRFRIATARRSHLHDNFPAARKRARTSLPSARRQGHVQRGDAGTCVRHRSGDRRSARTQSVHLANVLGNRRPKKQRPHHDCARSADGSFSDGRLSPTRLCDCVVDSREPLRNHLPWPRARRSSAQERPAAPPPSPIRRSARTTQPWLRRSEKSESDVETIHTAVGTSRPSRSSLRSRRLSRAGTATPTRRKFALGWRRLPPLHSTTSRRRCSTPPLEQQERCGSRRPVRAAARSSESR